MRSWGAGVESWRVKAISWALGTCLESPMSGGADSCLWRAMSAVCVNCGGKDISWPAEERNKIVRKSFWG